MHHSFCIDRLQWGSTVGHPSDSWASCFFKVFSRLGETSRRDLQLLLLQQM